MLVPSASSRRIPAAMGVVLSVVVGGACGNDGPATASPAPVTTEPAGLSRVALRVATEHVAFVVDHDGALSVSEMRDPSRDAGCGMTTAFFSGARDLRIEAVPTDCALAGPIEPAAGNHGRYRTIDDVDEPIDVEEIDTQLGPAVLFTQRYEGVEEPVAIVTLDDPVDPDYPTLVVRSDGGDFGSDELRSMLGTLGPASSLFDRRDDEMGG